MSLYKCQNIYIIIMPSCSEIFGYSAENKSNVHGTTFRSVVLHLKYVVFVLLGALVWGSFVAEQAKDVMRKDKCGLFGSTDVASTCPALTDATTTQNETLYGLGVSVAIINAVLLLLSFFTHLDPKTDNRVCATFQYHIVVRLLTAIVNIGLFAGLVGVFREDDDDNNGAKLLAEANLKNNIYFKDTFNPYGAAASGLAISLVDAVVGTFVIFYVYGNRCAIPADSGEYGSGN